MKLWEVATGRERRSFQGHTTEVTSVAFSPNGEFALSQDWETAKLWEVGTGRLLRNIECEGSPDLARLSRSRPAENWHFVPPNGALKLWKVETGQEVRSFMVGAVPVTSVALSPDGKLALSGGFNGMLTFGTVHGPHAPAVPRTYGDCLVPRVFFRWQNGAIRRWPLKSGAFWPCGWFRWRAKTLGGRRRPGASSVQRR